MRNKLSHHYGINKFKKTGCILITIINKSYCKISRPTSCQKHPNHRHFKKMNHFIY